MFSCFFCLFLQIWDSLSLRKPRPNDQSFYGQLHENHNDFHTYYFRACPACPSSHDGAESRGPTAAQPSTDLWWSLSVIFAESSKKWFAPDDSHTTEASAQYKTSGESVTLASGAIHKLQNANINDIWYPQQYMCGFFYCWKVILHAIEKID